MLRKYVFEKCEDVNEIKKDETFVKDASEQASIRERQSQDAEWQVQDMKKAEYMQDRIGMRAEGIISSVTSFGFYVQLEDTVEGLVRVASLEDDYYVFDQQRYMMVGARTNKTYAIGQKVMITVASADKDSAMIEFDIAKPKTERRSGGYSRSSADSRGRTGGYGRSSYGSKSSDSRGSYQKRSWQSKDGASSESGENTFRKPRSNYGHSASGDRGRTGGYSKSSYGSRSNDSRGSYEKKPWQSKDGASSESGENTFRKPRSNYGHSASGD
ncbi:MAG: S1 RNA-binding domain-containing protein, partial [Erysipelotrichia bacterium]|nr:S1 RNA-binding domain-containing protein [Erysipelotrichia bacterium]